MIFIGITVILCICLYGGMIVGRLDDIRKKLDKVEKKL